MKKNNEPYLTSFNLEAIRRYRDSGSFSQVSRELGIPESTLRNWFEGHKEFLRDKKEASKQKAVVVAQERSALVQERARNLEASPQELLRVAVACPWDVLANPSLPLLALENPSAWSQLTATAQFILAFSKRNVRLQAWRDEGGLPICGKECRWWKVATNGDQWWFELKLLCSRCVPKGSPKRKKGGMSASVLLSQAKVSGSLRMDDPDLISKLSQCEQQMARCSHLSPLRGEDPPVIEALAQKLFEQKLGHPCNIISKGVSRYSTPF